MTNPKCPTCSDYHFVCRESGKTPCPLKTDYIGNVPKGGHLHDYVPCPDCSGGEACPTCNDSRFVRVTDGKIVPDTDWQLDIEESLRTLHGNARPLVTCPDCMRPSKDSYTGCICGYPTWQSVLPKFIEDHFPKGHADRGVAMTAVIMFMLENYG
jgi:hypothetical protein